MIKDFFNNKYHYRVSLVILDGLVQKVIKEDQ